MATATQLKPSSPPAAGRDFSALGRLIRRPEAGSFLGMVAVFVFFTVIAGDAFVSAAGFAGWLNVAAEVGIVALPSAFS
jgi:simple sugar transport system permease protein